MRKALLSLCLVAALLPVATYLSLPWLATWAVERWLAEQGYADARFEMRHPGWQDLEILAFSVTHQGEGREYLLAADRIQLHTRPWDLMRLRLAERIEIGYLQFLVRSEGDFSARAEQISEELTDLAPEYLAQLFSHLPSEELEIQHLQIGWQLDDAPYWSGLGFLQASAQKIEGQLQIYQADQARAELNLRLNPTQSLALSLSQDGQTFWQLDGQLHYQPQPNKWLLDTQQRFSLAHLPSAWREEWALLSHFSEIELELNSQIHFPRQVNLQSDELWQALDAQGTLDVQLALASPASASLQPLSSRGFEHFQLSGPWSWRDTQLKTQLQLASPSLATPVQLDLSGQPQKNLRLKAQMAPIQAGSLAHQRLQALIPEWPELLIWEAGRLQLSLEAQGNLARWQVQIQSQLSAGTLQYAGTLLEEVNWQQTLTLIPELNWSATGQIQLGLLDLGLAIQPSRLDYRLTPRSDGLQLTLQPFQLDLLGGQALFPGLNLNLLKPESIFLVSLRQLSLDEILSLYNRPGLSGEGILEGQLPIQIHAEGIEIHSGLVGSIEPGWIRFQPDEALQASARGNLGLELALGALSDLRFSLLDFQLSYAVNGDLQLQGRFQGHNPDWQQGRPIDLSLNIQDNLKDLLRALQMSRRITDRLDQRLQR
ncbi:intermembrane phospholipid transport protein YdbH family protein [Nitrincola tapanii]|uniref:Uncharacterized protein n=1 Tax=Nitrincola tapanii TaxID=1708751 RepID=A0A5A9W0V5_9GAMM|nr:YdbH domain-containing protein [Nitrincola tapanii]KAA0874183.1 hypothetical protein E1H14_10435 [Nitrincola tapanii]